MRALEALSHFSGELGRRACGRRSAPQPRYSSSLPSQRQLPRSRSSGLGRVERFFSGRVREHMREKNLAHGAELLRLVRGSNVEYDRLLERLLTQETSFNRYPAIFSALEKRLYDR